MKPTHLIGGYAQLSFGFNYYGPTGSQRDEVTVCASARERWCSDEDPGAGRHGDEPRQVHRLPHLQRHLQAGLDQPARRRVHVVQRRRDQARRGLPQALGGPGALARRLGAGSQGAPAAEGGRPARSCSPSSPTPICRTIDDYYEPWTYDYEKLTTAPLSEHDPVARPASQLTGKPLRRSSGGPTGTTTWPAPPSASRRTR